MWPKSEAVEPTGTAKWNNTIPIALQPTTDSPEASVGAASSPEVLLVIHLMIARNETPAGQSTSIRFAHTVKSELPRTKVLLPISPRAAQSERP